VQIGSAVDSVANFEPHGDGKRSFSISGVIISHLVFVDDLVGEPTSTKERMTQ
jgi:hypothetical protein